MTITLLTGDCRDVLPTLPSNSVHCVVTSPPYYGLRDYGTAQWEGGAEGCDHQQNVSLRRDSPGGFHNSTSRGTQASTIAVAKQYADECGKCGARRIDRQLGLESDPEAYLAAMVGVFREIRRVMRHDATLWLNCGDAFTNKQLQMMPARLALALQADGFYLRSDIIWAKPNPMPESCTDRPTSAHEHVFLLTKAARYFYDADAVREEGEGYGRGTGPGAYRSAKYVNGRSHDNSAEAPTSGAHGHSFEGGRNLRNVWRIATHAFPEAHFATYPPELVERCIRAGTSERGCCAACGAPWVRITEKGPPSKETTRGLQPWAAETGQRDSLGGLPLRETFTTGWRASCQCNADTQPCTVLDPFLGSGTTALVADRLQRHCIGIDLSLTYADMAQRRIEQDCPLFTSWPPAEDPEDERMRDLFAEAAE